MHTICTSLLNNCSEPLIEYATELDLASSCCKIVISNDVGVVKHFLSGLLHALEEERHFALVGGLRFPTWARF